MTFSLPPGIKGLTDYTQHAATKEKLMTTPSAQKFQILILTPDPWLR